MAWIESHQELARHPKTARLARLLGVSKPCAIGHLHLFWWWCMDYARDGSLADFTPDEIADGSMWDGDTAHFLESLQSAGFVDGDAVHDWDEYAGKLIQKRQTDAERKRLARLAEAEKSSTGHPSDIRRTAQVPTQPTQQTKPTDTTMRVVSSDCDEARLLDETHTRRFAADAGYTEAEINEAFRLLTKRSSPPKDLHRYVMGTLANLRTESAAPVAPPKPTFVPKLVNRDGR